jgi:hypothetical protein
MARPQLPWPPPKEKWPAGFSLHRDGWARSYKGRTVVISGKTRTPRDVAERFAAKCLLIDRGRPMYVPQGNNVTLRDLANAYYAAEDRRVARGKIAERSAANVQGECNRFGEHVGGHRQLSTIGPNDFAGFYEKYLDGKSPETINTTIGRVTKMFRWAVSNGLVERVIYGDDWARPRKTERRAHRVRTDKAFKWAEVAKLWQHASPMWRCWIALAAVAGFTNSDCAHLTRDVLAGGVIDYRRRKTGQTRRVIVLPQEVRDVFATYRRPEPADDRYADFVFLTEAGTPYDVAPDRSRSCREFRELQEAAGVYKKNRSFTALRTACFNNMLDAPALASGIIMGRKPKAMSETDWDSYLEHVDTKPIAAITAGNWARVKTELSGEAPAGARQPARRATRGSRAALASSGRSRRG